MFAPALAFSGTQLSLTLGAYALALALVSATGAGAEVLSAGAGLPLVGEALGKIDPNLGTTAGLRALQPDRARADHSRSPTRFLISFLSIR